MAQAPPAAGGAVFVACYWRAKPGQLDAPRIFRLKDAAAEQGLAAGLDAATLRVVPSEAQRKANSERSAGLRDLVRREVWTELK
jgi:hypothetical protein